MITSTIVQTGGNSPHLVPSPNWLERWPRKKSRFFSHCRKALLKVWYRSSTADVQVIFAVSKSRCLCMYSRFAFPLKSQLFSMCPPTIFSRTQCFNELKGEIPRMEDIYGFDLLDSIPYVNG
jgi:hypothetical protein